MSKAKLSPNEVIRIVRMLEAWEGALTWEGLVAALPNAIGRPFTSQTLRRHAPIASAFGHAKSRSQAIRLLMRRSVNNPVSKRFLLDLAGAAAGPRPKKPGLRSVS